MQFVTILFKYSWSRCRTSWIQWFKCNSLCNLLFFRRPNRNCITRPFHMTLQFSCMFKWSSTSAAFVVYNKCSTLFSCNMKCKNCRFLHLCIICSGDKAEIRSIGERGTHVPRKSWKCFNSSYSYTKDSSHTPHLKSVNEKCDKL